VALLVQKFGGTSVGSIDRIRNVAKCCLAAQRAGNDVVLIVSAMSGETNRLLKLAHEVTAVPDAREMDAIAATGEQVAAALTSMAIQAEGGKAQSLLGHQVRILTDGLRDAEREPDAFPGTVCAVIGLGCIFGTLIEPVTRRPRSWSPAAGLAIGLNVAASAALIAAGLHHRATARAPWRPSRS